MSKQFSNWTDQEDVKRTGRNVGEGMKNDEIDSSSLGCWSVDFGKSRISKEEVDEWINHISSVLARPASSHCRIKFQSSISRHSLGVEILEGIPSGRERERDDVEMVHVASAWTLSFDLNLLPSPSIIAPSGWLVSFQACWVNEIEKTKQDRISRFPFVDYFFFFFCGQTKHTHICQKWKCLAQLPTKPLWIERSHKNGNCVLMVHKTISRTPVPANVVVIVEQSIMKHTQHEQ